LENSITCERIRPRPRTLPSDVPIKGRIHGSFGFATGVSTQDVLIDFTVPLNPLL
jgi:hypothetical protein